MVPPISASFLSAAVAATAELSLLHPLDLAKTRLQGASAPCGGLRGALGAALGEGGLPALWRGFGPGLAIVVPRRGFKFAANERFGAMLAAGGMLNPLTKCFVSGAMAGACEAVLITPLETVKVQMQTARADHVALGARAMATRLWQTDGLAALYAGLGATVCKHTAHSCVYFGVFRATQPSARAAGRSQIRGDLTAGFTAGVAAGTVNNPFDVVKTRQQAAALQKAAGTAGRPNASTMACLRTILMEEGLRALFAGWGAKVARLGPGSAIIFATYHAVNDALCGSGRG